MYSVMRRLNDCLATRKYPNSPIVAPAKDILVTCIAPYTYAYMDPGILSSLEPCILREQHVGNPAGMFEVCVTCNAKCDQVFLSHQEAHQVSYRATPKDDSVSANHSVDWIPFFTALFLSNRQ